MAFGNYREALSACSDPGPSLGASNSFLRSSGDADELVQSMLKQTLSARFGPTQTPSEVERELVSSDWACPTPTRSEGAITSTPTNSEGKDIVEAHAAHLGLNHLLSDSDELKQKLQQRLDLQQHQQEQQFQLKQRLEQQRQQFQGQSAPMDVTSPSPLAMAGTSSTFGGIANVMFVQAVPIHNSNAVFFHPSSAQMQPACQLEPNRNFWQQSCDNPQQHQGSNFAHASGFQRQSLPSFCEKQCAVGAQETVTEMRERSRSPNKRARQGPAGCRSTHGAASWKFQGASGGGVAASGSETNGRAVAKVEDTKPQRIPDASPEEWEKRFERRTTSLNNVKSSDYYRNNQDYQASDRPATPKILRKDMSKREVEAAVYQWRSGWRMIDGVRQLSILRSPTMSEAEWEMCCRSALEASDQEDADQAKLILMGYDVDKAQKALKDAEGSLEGAVALLAGEQ